jgi:hypothetical protein
LKEICDKLDDALLESFPNDGIKFAGLCQLVTKTNQPHPVTIEDNKQISIDDKWSVIAYHRLNGDAGFDQSDEQDFGRSTGRKLIQPMIMVVATKKEKGEEWIYGFMQEFPESLNDSSLSETYEFIDIDSMSLEVDHEGIYNREFGEGNYEKHRIPWNLWGIKYDVSFIRC